MELAIKRNPAKVIMPHLTDVLWHSGACNEAWQPISTLPHSIWQHQRT
jgi:hypothetical protein